MVNLAGIFDTRESEKGISEALSKIVPDVAGDFRIHQVTTPFFGCKNIVHGFMNTPQQPFVSPDKRFYAFAEGEIYSSPSGDTSLSYLFEHFLRNGLSRWESVNGQFVLVVYDTQAKKLNIINDRFGFRQLYFLHKGDAFLFGSQIKSVIALEGGTPDLSPQGIAQFLFFGYHIGQETSFEDIKILPPASILTVSSNSFTVRSYWSPVYQADESTNATSLLKKLTTAVDRQIGGGGAKGILLSGGMDSRVIAHEYVKRDPSLVAFTFGFPNSMDVQFARHIAEVLDIEHHILQFVPEKWKEHIPMVVTQTEGEASFHHFKSIQFHPFMSSKCNTIMTGLSGDMILGSFIQKEHMGIIDPQKMVDYLFLKFLEHPVEHLKVLLRPDSFEVLQSQIKSTIKASLDNSRNSIAADILDEWNIQNRQRRFILIGPASDRYLFNIRSPFFDYDLYDYSLKIPPHKRYKEKLYLEALWQGMPKLQGTPWQKTGKLAFPDEVPPLHFDKRLTCLSEITGKNLSFNGQSLAKEFVDFAKLLRQAYSSKELSELLFGGTYKWHAFFDIDRMMRIVTEHMSGNSDNFILICKMLSLTYCERNIAKS